MSRIISKITSVYYGSFKNRQVYRDEKELCTGLNMYDVRFIDVEIDCKKIGEMTIILIKSTLEN